MIRPSMTMLSACTSAGLIRLSPFGFVAPNPLLALWGQHIPWGRGDPMQKRLGYCRKRQCRVVIG
jgi:hypothetical protein